MRRRRRRGLSGVDFDEEGLQIEMAKELDADPDDIVVDESHLSSFGEEVFEVSFGGNKSWLVVEDDDAAERLALAVVTQDLEDEPEMFNPEFIESHIDMDALRSYVYDVVMDDDYAYEISSDPFRFWREAEHRGIDVPEEDEDGNMPDDVDDEYIEALKEAIAEDRSKNPMDWFEDIYGDEAPKYAIEAVGFDIEDAAEEAVNTDGWQHFLCRYDGNSTETDSGFVYWREN